MSANSGSGGVRNLRAMFENKATDQSTSPPSRGRSPNPSEISNHSRPVSKVRTSFVAVERPGENGGAPILGLRRASEVSNREDSKANEDAIVDTGNMGKQPGTEVASTREDPFIQPQKTNNADDGVSGGGLGNILKGSAFDAESTPSKPPSDATKLAAALTSGQAKEKIARLQSHPKNSTKSSEMINKMRAAQEGKPGPPSATTLQTSSTAQPVKAPPTRQIVTRPVPKSPTVSKPSPKTPTSPSLNLRGGPAKIRGVMDSAKRAQEERDAAKQSSKKAEKEANPRSSAPKLETHSRAKQVPEPAKKERTPTSPRAVRPPSTAQPRSPTMPTKLPSAATASTASSAAKHEAHHSPTEPTHKSIAKRPSTMSIRPPRVSTSSTTSSLAKKTSRASLTNGHVRPSSRVSTSKPDEGFLARMMRPTTSSAQKMHDKVHISSPPRPKIASANKPKQQAKQKPPPGMNIAVLKEGTGEDKENTHTHDQSTLPEDTAASLLDPVKEDSTMSTAEQDPSPAEPIAAVEHANGEVQEV